MAFGRSDDEWYELIDLTVPILEAVAANKSLTNYTAVNMELADQLGGVPFDFTLERDRAAIGAVLGEVVARTYGRAGAMLSAVVKFMRDNDPGAGFYKLAESKGWLRPGGDRLAFWSEQLAKLYDYYSGPEYDDLRPGRTRQRATEQHASSELSAPEQE